jgi:hypothetical protein
MHSLVCLCACVLLVAHYTLHVLKTEAVCSSEVLVKFYHTTHCYIYDSSFLSSSTYLRLCTINYRPLMLNLNMSISLSLSLFLSVFCAACQCFKTLFSFLNTCHF